MCGIACIKWITCKKKKEKIKDLLTLYCNYFLYVFLACGHPLVLKRSLISLNLLLIFNF